MEPSDQTPPQSEPAWVYASLTVIDGSRLLQPAQISFDRIRFREPPRIVSPRIELILTNGDEEQRQFALVLPHDADAMLIPIQLVPAERECLDAWRELPFSRHDSMGPCFISTEGTDTT